MINSIRLVNWRSHSDTKLQFHEGTNLLVGIMGSGKSSVLEGISFALYGTFPALERRRLKIENLIRYNEPMAKVALEFAWDGSGFRVEREIERTKRATSTKAEVFKDGKLVEHGTSSVTRYIEDLTDVDYDLFTRAIYSDQNNIDHFLNLDPRRRKQEIDTLLGLDKFETARANVVSVIGRVRDRRKAFESRFSKEKLEEKESKEKEHSAQASSKEKSLSEAKGEIEAKRKQADALLSSFETMKKDRARFESLEKGCISLRAQQESLSRQLVPVDEVAYARGKARLEETNKERSRLSEDMESLEAKASSLSRESGRIQADIKALSEAKARMERLKKGLFELLQGQEPEALEERRKEAEKDILSLQSEAKSLERQVSEVSELLPKLKVGLSECPLCSQGLDAGSIEHIREEKAHLVAKSEKRMAELSALLSKRRKEKESLEGILQKAMALSAQLSSIEAGDPKAAMEMAASLDKEMDRLKAKKGSLQEALDKLGKEQEALRLDLGKQEDAMKMAKQLLDVRKALSEAESELESIKFDRPAFEKLSADAEEARLALERLSSSAKLLESELARSRELLKMVREELLSLHGLQDDIAGLSRMEEELAIYKNALLETQTSLRGSLTDAINGAMNEIWPIFYPYHNYKALRLKVSEKDYIFEVDDGEWKSLDTIASGGERASAALTLRVALAMILTPNLSWLILDEPTHNLDSEAVELLSSALQYKVPEVVRQTFVITHDEAFMGSDFASSYRLSRDKGSKGDTKTEAI